MNAELIKGPQRAIFKWDHQDVCDGYVLVSHFDTRGPADAYSKTHSITFARRYWERLIADGYKRASHLKDDILRKPTTQLLNEFEAAIQAEYRQKVDEVMAKGIWPPASIKS